MNKYDCTDDVNKHIGKVQELMVLFAGAVADRADWHDHSKLHNAHEKEMFDTWVPRLQELEYGSSEYTEALKNMGDGLKMHYDANRHHPQHYENGIDGMTLVDLVEMVCDWVAVASLKGEAVDIAVNAKRFNISPQVANIIANTIRSEMK